MVLFYLSSFIRRSYMSYMDGSVSPSDLSAHVTFACATTMAPRQDGTREELGGWSLLSPHSLAVRPGAELVHVITRLLYGVATYTYRLHVPVRSVRAHVATTLAAWPANATCQATLLLALLMLSVRNCLAW